MDEQRFEAYVSLIGQLLSCPSGEEVGILEAHQELLDRGFLEVASAIVQRMRTDGNEQAADWLMNFVQHLSEAILASEEAESDSAPDQATWQFILEMLQLVAESKGNPEQVYPFFAANQNQLNVAMLQALPTAFNVLIDAGDKDEQQFIAATFGEFANLIQRFPLGQRWLNLELAIQAYELALQVYTRDDFPEQESVSIFV